MKNRRRAAVAGLAFLVAASAAGPSARAADRKITYSMPNLSVTFAYAYIAKALGYWKDEGLDVDLTILGGGQNSHAVLAGDVEFGASSGINGILAAAAGQQLLAIVNVHSRLEEALYLGPEAAAKTGLDSRKASEQDKAKALKGMVIGVDGGPGAIPDGTLKYIAHGLGGLDPDRDITITYLPPGGQVAIVQSKKADGMVSSAPYTTIGYQKNGFVPWFEPQMNDLPELHPFVFDTIAVRSDYCGKNADICRKFLAGVGKAMQLMRTNPEKGLEAIKPTYKDMDSRLLQTVYNAQAADLNPTGKMTDAWFKTTQDFAVGSGMLKATQTLGKFEGVTYTNAYW